jgi:hypothetical protein
VFDSFVIVEKSILICRVGAVAMRCGNSRVGEGRASGSDPSYIAVQSVDGVGIAEIVEVEISVDAV